jgi:hypothetical protein
MLYIDIFFWLAKRSYFRLYNQYSALYTLYRKIPLTPFVKGEISLYVLLFSAYRIYSIYQSPVSTYDFPYFVLQ